MDAELAADQLSERVDVTDCERNGSLPCQGMMSTAHADSAGSHGCNPMILTTCRLDNFYVDMAI
jgi:hypothetical protein